MIHSYTVLARTSHSFFCEIITGLSEHSARQAFLRYHPGYEIISLTEIQ